VSARACRAGARVRDGSMRSDEKEAEAESELKQHVGRALIPLLVADKAEVFVVGARALALLLQASPSLGMPVVSFGIKRPQKKGSAAAHVVDADAPPTDGAEDGEEDAPVLTSLLFKTDSYDRKAKVRRRRRSL
jgi:hypothetical protein